MGRANPPVYLDYNATAPIRPEARAAMLDAMSAAGNPSSVHGPGRAARARLEAARRRIADFLGAAPGNVVFTSGGTEANLIALRGSGRRRVLVSAIEHAAVLGAAPGAGRVPVGRDGLVDLGALDAMLAASGEPALVSVMWANNETGAIQPVAGVVEVARRHGALVHSDAVQAAGKLPLDFAASGLDAMSVSAHKLGGPPGVGALLVAEGAPVSPLAAGGGQERGRRAGTENLPGVAGFAAAVEAAAADPGEAARVRAPRDGFEARLAAAAPEARILCREVERLGNTSCVVMPGVAAETQVMALDLEGIAVSAGAACSSGKVRRSHVVDAMEPEGEAAGCALRVSFGRTNGPEDVERVVAAWLRLYKRAGRTARAAA